MELKREDFPDDVEDMINIKIVLEPSPIDNESTCPVEKGELLEYLGWEAPGGEHSGGERIIDFQLQFKKSVEINGSRHWIWFFTDERNAESYVAVKVDSDGQQILSYDETFGLNEDQILIVEHFDMNCFN